MATAAQQMAGMARRQARIDARFKWFDQRVASNIKIGMTARLRLAAQLLRDQVVVNISRPVYKYRSRRTGRIVVDPASRSKPGEYPKADTTRLMKDIFYEMRSDATAIVGTTLDYGLVLETRMNRSFLRRTFRQLLPSLRTVLTAGKGGGQTVDLPGQE